MNSVKNVTIYTTQLCSFCHRAKALLSKKDVAFNEIDVTFSAEQREEMTRLANGRTTVPQIFIGDRHIGGCDELFLLEDQGKLDDLLAV